MLRNCEADLRRELSKTQSKPNTEQDIVINNRKELYETVPIPSSPVKINYTNGNGGRFSPRKTHLTNFISQNVTPAELMRRQNTAETTNYSSSLPIESFESKMKRSPCLQFNANQHFNRTKLTPPKSPMPRRRFRSQSPRVCIEESDSDSDAINANAKNDLNHKKLPPALKRKEINGNKENKLRHSWRKNRQSFVKDDIINQNTINTTQRISPENQEESIDTIDNRLFRSVDMAHRCVETYYCPQSEPLKRKIYSEKALDRLQKSLDMESGKEIFIFHFIFRIPRT